MYICKDMIISLNLALNIFYVININCLNEFVYQSVSDFHFTIIVIFIFHLNDVQHYFFNTIKIILISNLSLS